MDLQKLPTDIIKIISKHLIKDDFKFNEIMYNKIDTGLTNFFFKPFNNINIYKYFQYLGPNEETQYFNIGSFKSLFKKMTVINFMHYVNLKNMYHILKYIIILLGGNHTMR